MLGYSRHHLGDWNYDEQLHRTRRGMVRDYVSNPQRCTFAPVFEWASWLIPLLIAFIFIAVIYVIILIKFNKIKHLHKNNVFQRQFKKKLNLQLSLYILIFLACWFPDFGNLYETYHFTVNHLMLFGKCKNEVVTLIVLFFSPLQG